LAHAEPAAGATSRWSSAIRPGVARIDRQTATSPLELLAMVTMFNPPVGMG
jgi:hypothetical protein